MLFASLAYSAWGQNPELKARHSYGPLTRKALLLLKQDTTTVEDAGAHDLGPRMMRNRAVLNVRLKRLYGPLRVTLVL